MQIVVNMLGLLFLVIIIFNFIIYLKDSTKQERTKVLRRSIIIFIVVFTLGSISYIPRRIITFDHTEVERIVVKDGNTDKTVEIYDADKIKFIVENLNEVTFKKTQFTLFNLGYSFNTQFWDKDENLLKEIIINSESSIRYKAFSYKTCDNLIDYDYILEIFRSEYDNYKQ